MARPVDPFRVGAARRAQRKSITAFSATAVAAGSKGQLVIQSAGPSVELQAGTRIHLVAPVASIGDFAISGFLTFLGGEIALIDTKGLTRWAAPFQLAGVLGSYVTQHVFESPWFYPDDFAESAPLSMGWELTAYYRVANSDAVAHNCNTVIQSIVEIEQTGI